MLQVDAKEFAALQMAILACLATLTNIGGLKVVPPHTFSCGGREALTL